MQLYLIVARELRLSCKEPAKRRFRVKTIISTRRSEIRTRGGTMMISTLTCEM